MTGEDLPWTPDVDALTRAALCLESHDYPPNFLLAYDEAWQLMQQVSRLVQDATNGNETTSHIFAWLVNAGQRGFAPHRDHQPDDIRQSFRKDGTPRSVSSWIALTDATPGTSCLYVVPA